jgi:hypothetical protein
VSINAITSPNRRVLDFNQQDLESFTANSDQRDPFYGEIGWDGRLVKTLISIDGNCQSQQCVIEALDEPPALGIDSGAYAAGQYSSGGSLVGTESINGRSAEIFHISYKESDNVDHDALSQYRIAKVDADTFAVLGIADYDGDQVRQSIDLMSQEQVTMSAQDFQEISADALAVMAPEPREAILFENSLQIAGYVLLPESSNQDNLFFTVFWQSEEAVTDDNYRGIIHVQDENGTLVTEVSAPLRWQTDNGNVKAQITFRDVHQWPNGRYQIYAGIYDQEVGQNLLSDSGEEMILVDTIVLEESAVPANDMAENQIPFGDNIALTHDHYIQGATVEREEVHILRFLWEARQTPTENLTAFVHLLNENGQVVQQQDQELIWTIATGQMVKPGFTEYALQSVEVDLPDGRYQVQVGVYDPATGQRLITADGGTVLQIDELVIENKPTN